MFIRLKLRNKQSKIKYTLTRVNKICDKYNVYIVPLEVTAKVKKDIFYGLL